MSKLLAKQFLKRVISVLNNQSDPAIIKKILKDLRLTSFKPRDKGFKNFLEKITEQPIHLTCLIKAVEKGLLNNKPLCDLFAFLEREQVLTDDHLQGIAKQLNTQLNLLCLFEAFAVTMVNSFTLNEDLYCFINKQRNTAFPGNPIYNFFFGSSRRNFSLFKNLKLVSVDPVMTEGAFIRSLGNEELDKDAILERSREFISKHGLSLWNSKICPLPSGVQSDDSVKNVSLNILEATWEEKKKNDGQPGDNAFAGAALIRLLEHIRPPHSYAFANLILPDESEVSDGETYSLFPDLKVNPLAKRVSQFDISKEWMNLYNSWNLFFVIQNLDSQFLPIKLLVPSVLNALPSHYMETRVLLLYLMGNLYHYNQLSIFKEEMHLPQSEMILSQWGEINKKYADTLLAMFCPNSEETSEMVYATIFGAHANFSLAYHIANFMRDFDSFQITSEESELQMEFSL